ncbi:MAG: hypothetical protein JNM98_06230 [Rhodocyclaceae bacterium]|nr:hypothetical protein [Rhodocyclaceae bacterium]
MGANDASGYGDLTAAMVDYVVQHGPVRSPELAERFGVPPNSVCSHLSAAVACGHLVSCDVINPTTSRACKEFRAGAAAARVMGWQAARDAGRAAKEATRSGDGARLTSHAAVSALRQAGSAGLTAAEAAALYADFSEIRWSVALHRAPGAVRKKDHTTQRAHYRYWLRDFAPADLVGAIPRLPRVGGPRQENIQMAIWDDGRLDLYDDSQPLHFQLQPIDAARLADLIGRPAREAK